MSARRQYVVLAIIFIIIVAISIGMNLTWPGRPIDAEKFRERLAASLRDDSAEWQSVHVHREKAPYFVTVMFGSQYSFAASKVDCYDQEFVLVAVVALETGDEVCRYGISKDGSQIRPPRFLFADDPRQGGPRHDDPELTGRAFAIAAAYWAATEP